MTVVNFELQLNQLTQSIDGVEDASQKMLYTNQAMSEDLTLIQDELELHNSLNPHQNSIAKLKDLEEKSDSELSL